MRIKVSEMSVRDSAVSVAFETEIGTGQATWQGETPAETKTYHVEVNVDETLDWGTTVLNHNKPEHRIYVQNGYTHLIGTLESTDDTGLSVLRIGDSIIEFEATGQPFPLGSPIELIAGSISLWPYNL